jgi:hypothetical protein
VGGWLLSSLATLHLSAQKHKEKKEEKKKGQKIDRRKEASWLAT